MERTQGNRSRGGENRAGPKPPDREEGGERRRPYLSRAGHVDGGPSRCLRSQSSGASRLAGQGCSKPARPQLHRDPSRRRGPLPLPAPAETHFRSPAGGFHVAAMLDAAHRKGPTRARGEPARPGRPAPAFRPHLKLFCALHPPLQLCGPLLPVEHSLASRPLHLLFLVSVVLRNRLSESQSTGTHSLSLSENRITSSPSHTHTLSLCLSLREQNYLLPILLEHNTQSCPYPAQFFSISLRTI